MNWGCILSEDGELTLAPTFDHASSLGRNESDVERVIRLDTKDRGRSVEAYVVRARSAFYSNPSSNKPLTTLEAFQEAAKIFPEAKQYWLRQLEATSLADYERIFNNVPPPEISIPATEFALRVLEINRRRLLQRLECRGCYESVVRRLAGTEFASLGAGGPIDSEKGRLPICLYTRRERV